MRVLFLLLDPEISGRTRVFATAAAALSDRGHAVTVVCPEDAPAESVFVNAPYEVHPIRAEGAWLGLVLRLRELLAERFIEAVFVHAEREQFVAAAASRLAGRAPVVRRVPAGELPDAGTEEWIASQLAATGWLFAADEDRKAAGDRIDGALPATSVPLGVAVEEYGHLEVLARAAIGPAAHERLIVCVHDPAGRVAAAVALRVMALLAPLHPTLGLVFVGPGTFDQELRVHAAALGINRHVAFLGPRPEPRGVMRAAEIGWVTATGDDAAYAFLDFAALGIPVIAPRSALSRRYITDGITGALIGHDAHAAAAATARLLADPSAREAMGRAAQIHVAREWTAQAMADGFERTLLTAGERSRWAS
ncbi:MAG TPA: glycosyltransferase family 4 protein [Gemmatimonadaceae bacterium]|nr:glycosyltransferase family 4 protein [Gemmatimonadaceae bacterium]